MLLDKLLKGYADLAWYDKKALGIPLFESNHEVVLSCKDFEENAHLNLFHPFVRRGECANIIADSIACESFTKNFCFAGAKGYSCNFQWNKDVPTNILLCRYSDESYFGNTNQDICKDINVIEMAWDNSENSCIDKLLDDTEKAIQENNISLLVCNELAGYFCLDTKHVLRRLDDIAEKYNIAVVALWDYMCDIHEINNVEILFTQAHNLCFLSGIRLVNIKDDEGWCMYLFVFEFGGILNPKVQYFIINDSDELAINNKLNEFIRLRNLYAICAPDNKFVITDKLHERINGKLGMFYSNNTTRSYNSKAKELFILDSIPNGTRTKYRYNSKCEYNLKTKS